MWVRAFATESQNDITFPNPACKGPFSCLPQKVMSLVSNPFPLPKLSGTVRVLGFYPTYKLCSYPATVKWMVAEDSWVRDKRLHYFQQKLHLATDFLQGTEGGIRFPLRGNCHLVKLGYCWVRQSVFLNTPFPFEKLIGPFLPCYLLSSIFYSQNGNNKTKSHQASTGKDFTELSLCTQGNNCSPKGDTW